MRRRRLIFGFIALAMAVTFLTAFSRKPDRFAELRPYVVSEQIQYYEWPATLMYGPGDPTQPVRVRTLLLKGITREELHRVLHNDLAVEGGWDLPSMTVQRRPLVGPQSQADMLIESMEQMPRPFYSERPLSWSSPDLSHWIRGLSESDYYEIGCFNFGPFLTEAQEPYVREFEPISKLDYWIIRVKHLGNNPFADPWKQ